MRRHLLLLLQASWPTSEISSAGCVTIVRGTVGLVTKKTARRRAWAPERIFFLTFFVCSDCCLVALPETSSRSLRLRLGTGPGY